MLQAIRLLATDIRDRLLTPTRAATTGRAPWQRFLTGDRQPVRDPDLIRQLQHYSGWVYKATTVIADRVASIPFVVNRVDAMPDGTERRTPVPLHPLYLLLGGGGGRKPNPLMTAYNLKKLSQLDLDLTGNAYWFKARNPRGLVQELWRLRPDKMVPVVNGETGLLNGWAWADRTGGTTRVAVWRPDEIVHFMYPSPILAPYQGMAPLRASVYAVDIDEANKRYQYRFFSSGTQLGLALSTDQGMDDDLAAEILEQFEARHQGLDNAWLPAILTNGLKATPMGAANKDLEAVALMEFSRDDILSTYNVPKTKVGLGDLVNRASADALDVTFNREAINPRLRNLEEQIEADLLLDFGTLGLGDMVRSWLEVDYQNPVPEDRDFLLRETETLRGLGDMRPNEARQRHGMPPFEGEYGTTVQVGLGATLIDPAKPLPPALAPGANETPPPPNRPGDPPPESEELAEDIDEEDNGERLARVARRATEAQVVAMPWHTDEALRSAMWVATATRAARWEELATGIFVRTFRRQATRAIGRVRALLEGRGDQVVLQDVGEALTAARLGPTGLRELREALATLVGRIYRVDGAQAFALAVKLRPRPSRGAPTKPIPSEQQAFSWESSARQHLQARDNLLVNVGRNRFRAIMETVERVAFSATSDGGSATIARALRDALQGDAVRALRVARTEVGAATNGAALDGFEAGGASHKGWLATRDGRERDSHAALDGDIVPIDAAFANGLQHPGDETADADEVINCRCALTPEFSAAG